MHASLGSNEKAYIFVFEGQRAINNNPNSFIYPATYAGVSGSQLCLGAPVFDR